MLIALTLAATGAALGAGVCLLWDQHRRRRLRAHADALYEATLVEAEGLVETSRGVCEAQFMRLRTKWTQEFARQKQRLADHDVELGQREELSRLRADDVQRSDEDMQRHTLRLRKVERARMGAAKQVAALPEQIIEALSARANTHRHHVVKELVQRWVERASLQAQIAARQQEAHTHETAQNQGKRLLTLAMDRYHGVGHLERIQNTFVLSQRPDLASLCDAEGALHKAFVEMSGCDLWHDAQANSLTVRGDDPLARELGRRLIQQFERRAKMSVAQVHNDARKIHEALARDVETAGRKAFRVLDLTEAAPEVMDLVGRLQFRLSYSQNQWKHAVEVAHLCGMVAAELGYDVQLAKRGGLLHDIGKALTHEREGSHAVLGAEVARRCGEDERVCNAIGAHHKDELPTSPLAYIVAACDAISGARPGARRNTVTQYLAQIEELQRIASQSPSVRRVDIMQAGREVRVVVNGAAQGALEPGEVAQTPVLADDALYPLAQQIAREIEENIIYAGQIRVTVIRESRAVSVAY